MMSPPQHPVYTTYYCTINRTMKILDVGMADVGKPLRLAITGRMNAPSVDKISEVLGQDKVVQRLRDVLDKFL